MDDADLTQQCKLFCFFPERRKTAGLHLDKFAFGAYSVGDISANFRLGLPARPRITEF
jgi:hypothetical protein